MIDSLGTTVELADVFSDESLLRALLRFEAALAAAQARLGIVPHAAAETIGRVAEATVFDADAIAWDGRRNATIAIPFVKELTATVHEADPIAAGFVHWGATSQDLVDTAMILLLRRAREILARDQERLQLALRALSDRHAHSVMLGRTLLQPAPPVTFGYKAAGWFGAARRNWRRLSEAFEEGLQLQFGGAAGTLASYGDDGPALAVELGRELQLPVPEAPWHTHRDRLAAITAHCGIYTASLGKMARDVALLMQHEVAEAAEPGGGSSAMPNKRNPAGSVVALAAAARVPGLVAAFLSGMVQEHERAAGGWQAEWQTAVAVVEATGAALYAMAGVAENLTVDPERMRANLSAAGPAVLAEKAVMLLAPAIGRTAAQAQVAQSPPDNTGRPEDYLGAAEIFRRRLLDP